MRAGRFVIMGYNYERGLPEMLHSYGHRAEGHLSHAHRNVPERDNLWRRFLRREHVTPGMAEIGNVHFPPNASATTTTAIRAQYSATPTTGTTIRG